MNNIRRQQIAFRCPACATATLGFLGGLRSVSDMLRLRCSCDKYALEIKPMPEGRVHVLVPCIYCKDSHGYVLSSDIFMRDEPVRLPCPNSHHDIFFIGNEASISEDLERSAKELSFVLESFEADEVSDIQPMDVDEAESAPDPAIYDVLKFLITDLEDAQAIECPCGNGPYDLRFTEDGAEAYCESCGASYRFYARSASSAESYLSLDSIKLS